jgi:hypothetical protein
VTTESALLEVHFVDDRDFYSPGEEVAGTVRWRLPAPPAVLEVRLFWSTRGRGDRDFAVVASEAIEGAAAHGERRFRFQLPAGPYSFSGQLVSLLWAVELVAVEEDLAGHAELVMGPGGCEARIDGGGLAPVEGDGIGRS